jgi:hypothetical protein
VQALSFLLLLLGQKKNKEKKKIREGMKCVKNHGLKD